MYIYVNNIKNYFLNSMIFDYVCIVIEALKKPARVKCVGCCVLNNE